MAYGNTSVSSLLRAAKAAQAKQYSLEDSIAAYEYDLSPKGQADFEKYSAHLNNRIKQHQGTDPLKALNYQKTITSANRSFTSSELSRATTQVLYGNMDAGAKLNTMMQLYQRAVENGDENLAQRIEGQAASLQNSMARSFGGGGGYGGGSRKSAGQVEAENRIAALKGDLSYMVDSLKKGGNAALGQFEKGGKTYLGTIKGIVEEIAGTYRQLADSTDDPTKRQSFLEKADKIIAGDTKFDAGFKKGKLSLNDVNKFIQERGLGSNPTSVAVDIDGQAGLVRNGVGRFGTYNKGADGSTDFVPIRSQFKDEAFSRSTSEATNRLKSKGVDAKVSNGIVSFTNPVTGQVVQGTADQYGNVIYETVDDNGNPAVRRFVTGEGKDEAVSQQEIDAIIKNPGGGDFNRQVLEQGSMPQIGQALVNQGGPVGDMFKQRMDDIMQDPEALAKAQAGDYLGGALDYTGKKIGKLFQKTAASKMISDIGGSLGRLGKDWGYVKGKYNVNAFNPLSVMGALGSVMGDLTKQEATLKQARDLEKQNQELAFQRANEQAQRFLADQAARQRQSVVFRTDPQSLPASQPGNQPDARSIAVIRGAVGQKSPFGGPNIYGF